MTETSSRFGARRLINRLGIATFLVGLACAGGVYLTGKNQMARHSTDQPAVDSDSRDDTLSFEDSKTSSRSTEIYFGKIGVLFSTWFRRWEQLDGLQRLAILIATSSVLATLICFLLACRLQ
jgi:hypothetical protein